ncbi:hypothetical protein GA0115255_123206 [Streptomyces sp. Ncost-T6T-2b]|nr:hypothetical protein GA0115255_123206 [Streptomyces sp. Ncost-T6T-2b]
MTGVWETAPFTAPTGDERTTSPGERRTFQYDAPGLHPVDADNPAVRVLGEGERHPIGVGAARVLHGHLGGGEPVEPGVDLGRGRAGEPEHGNERAHAQHGPQGREDRAGRALQDAGDSLGQEVGHRQCRAGGELRMGARRPAARWRLRLNMTPLLRC